MNTELQILIISHNSSSVIFNLLDSLYKKFPITVVDNNSSDETVQRIKEQYSEVELIEVKSNVGYGRASNIVLENTNMLCF